MFLKYIVYLPYRIRKELYLGINSLYSASCCGTKYKTGKKKQKNLRIWQRCLKGEQSAGVDVQLVGNRRASMVTQSAFMSFIPPFFSLPSLTQNPQPIYNLIFEIILTLW